MSDFAAECKRLAAELERVTAALRDAERFIDLYGHSDRSNDPDCRACVVIATARAALAGFYAGSFVAGGARAAQEDK
jgi:hypothetical protein